MTNHTLLVAPLSTLPTAAAEVQRIGNLLHPDLLINQVALDSLLDALGKPYQYIHFACHASPNGIQLSDKSSLARHRLVQLLQQTQPACVFLNSCSSLEIAMELHEALPNCTVIATIVPVEDTEAYVTGSLFAAAVAKGADYPAAYEASRPPHTRIYIMLNGSARLNSPSDNDDQMRLTLQVWSELQRRMDDSDQVCLKALDAMRQIARDLRDVKQELTGIKHQLNQYQRRPTRTQALLWSGGYGVFCLVLTLAYKDIRDLLDLNPIPTLLVSMLLLLGAFILFVLGLGFQFKTDP